MRIAILSPRARPRGAGAPEAGCQSAFLAEAGRALARLGHEVDIYVRRGRAAVAQGGARLVEVPAGGGAAARWLPAFRIAALRAAEARGPYDVIWGSGWEGGWAAAQVAALTGAAFAQIFHGLAAPERPQWGAPGPDVERRTAAERAVVRRADRIVAASPSERDELIYDYGADPGRVELIPCGVDSGLFRPGDAAEARARLGLPQGEPTVVHVGRLLPRHDVPTLLRALALISESTDIRPRLVVVGGGAAEAAALRQVAIGAGVSAQVQLAGWQPPAAVRDYMVAADVVAGAAQHTNFGMAALEAMACGRAFAGTAVGGLTSLVADGQTGALVPPRDPRRLATVLYCLLSQPDLRARMGEAGRARAAGYSWRDAGRHLAALAEELAAHRRPLAARA